MSKIVTKTPMGHERIEYDITPMGAVRMTKADAWRARPEVLRYRAYKDLIRLNGVNFGNGDRILFVLPMPQSWSKKKRSLMLGAPHTQKPDTDNMLKGLMDSLYHDDAHIHHVGEMRKIWGETGKIIIIKRGKNNEIDNDW